MAGWCRVNREDIVRRLAAHEAAAAALREVLTAEARAEVDLNHTRPSWEFLDGSRVTVSLSSGGLVVTDEDAFIDWARARYPDEFVEVTTVRFRNEGFRKRIIAEMAEAIRTNGGHTLLPFVDWTAGGEYRSTSITIAADTKRRMAESARNYALAGNTMPELEGP